MRRPHRESGQRPAALSPPQAAGALVLTSAGLLLCVDGTLEASDTSQEARLPACLPACRGVGRRFCGKPGPCPAAMPCSHEQIPKWCAPHTNPQGGLFTRVLLVGVFKNKHYTLFVNSLLTWFYVQKVQEGSLWPPSPPQLPLYPGDKLSGFQGLFPEIFDTSEHVQFALPPAAHARPHGQEHSFSH